MKEKVRTNSSEEINNFYKIYYKNSKAIGNICTVCLLLDVETGKVLSRGIAICSLKDIHRKTTGRNIAIGRAIKAIKHKKSTEEINSDCEDGLFIIRHIKTSDKQIEKIKEDLKNYSFISSKIVNHNNKEYLRLSIPSGTPIWETKKLFNYKSEYKPTLSEEEERIISKKGKLH